MSPSEQTVEAAFLAYRRTRDPAMLARVYDRTASRLLAVALHVSSSAASAEDAVQDTFLFVLEHPERWEPSRPLVPWLLGILANMLRRSAHRASRAPDPARLDLPAAIDPLRAIETSEVLQEIERAIEHLPQPYRTVVLLRLRNGLSPADIAVALGREPSTVRTQLNRGIEMLRRLLPAGVAGLLVGTFATARGLAMVRETVLGRATAVHRLFVAEGRGAGLGLLRYLLGAAALAALIVAAWLPRSGSDRPAVAPDAPPTEVAHRATPPRTADPGGALAAEPDRRPAPLPADLARGALRVHVHCDGRPLGDASVWLEPVTDGGGVVVHHDSGLRGAWTRVVPGRPQPERLQRRATTDAAGRCTFDALPAGVWLAHALGQAAMALVVAGDTVDAVLPVDPDVRTVRGIVTAPDGVPIAGAELWTVREHVSPIREVVGRTAPDGTFRLTVAPFTTVGARQPGYCPVGRSVGRDEPAVVDVELRFREPGGRLRGRVVDAAGAPLGAASVQIGHSADARVVVFAARPRSLTRPFRVLTDTDGRFDVDGLATGSTVVAACAPEHGAAAQTVELRARETAEIELTLPRAATIVGRASDASGAHLAGVAVQVGGPTELGHRATTTDADGSFRLTGVTPGNALVTATDFGTGFATRALECGPGAAVEWNPTFGPGDLRIAGIVLDAGGRPFAGGYVLRVSGWRSETARLDAAGRFAFDVPLREVGLPTTLRIYARDPRGPAGRIVGVPLAIEDGLLAGRPEATIRIPATLGPCAWVRGRLAADTGTEAPAAVSLERDTLARPWRVRLDPLGPAGEFESGPVPAGRYRVVATGTERRAFGPFELRGGETLDLGSLAAAPQPTADRESLTRLRLAFVHPPTGAGTGAVALEIRSADGRICAQETMPWPDDGCSQAVVSLPPGDYRVVAISDSGTGADGVLHVTTGSPTHRALLFPLLPR
ncbi:MAG: sigma-70 family RNA polymerase sigma factor [Planctomycetes bacterium]|nr:sigma-70 family RNA polymerase sigma factor [Planctomycetota bacterium]